MLYLGIDQHARQITISLRDENGDVLLARQVSTQPEKINAFFQQLTRERLQSGDSFVAVLEVCGLNEWLIRMLQDYRCEKVILIQPDDRNKQKTDRRDAAALSELLWVNRERLLTGKPVRGLRQVDIANTSDQENRRLTTLRRSAVQARTRLVNKVRQILRRHNLQWQMPTKKFPTLRAIAWLKTLKLPEIDRLEMNHLLVDLEHIQERLKELEQVIRQHCETNEDARLIATIPGAAYFTATSFACRVGGVDRFPRSHSLANYWGLTPGCRNSGEKTQRLGSITKAGSSGNSRSLPSGQLDVDRGCGLRADGSQLASTSFWLEWPARRGNRTRHVCVCHNRAELLTITVSGDSRRNDLGAIASEKNDRNFPLQRRLK